MNAIAIACSVANWDKVQYLTQEVGDELQCTNVSSETSFFCCDPITKFAI